MVAAPFPLLGDKGRRELVNFLPDIAPRLGQPCKGGFDHGLFVPLKSMFPAANIPGLLLSLLHSLDPAAHINIAKALSAFKENLIIGVAPRPKPMAICLMRVNW